MSILNGEFKLHSAPQLTQQGPFSWCWLHINVGPGFLALCIHNTSENRLSVLEGPGKLPCCSSVS